MKSFLKAVFSKQKPPPSPPQKPPLKDELFYLAEAYRRSTDEAIFSDYSKSKSTETYNTLSTTDKDESFVALESFADIPYGRDSEREILIQRLLAENDSQANNLSIIPVCGPPGIGKTTLIRVVYDDPRVKKLYLQRCWFRGSGQLHTEKLMHEFFRSAGADWKGRRSVLIVLDDVVEFNIEDLRSFAGSGRIVVIISSERSVSPTWRPVEVSRLGDSDCWDLLMRCVFGEEIDAVMFEDVDDRIVALCGGLPWVVKIIGGVLWHVTDEQKWTDVYEDFSAQLKSMGDSVVAALMVSYNYLSEDQKSRLLMCVEFGKGIAFSEKEVFELWVKAGLHGSSHGIIDENSGDQYFKQLQRRALIESIYPINNETDMFVMSNIVYDFCLKIAEGDQIHRGLPGVSSKQIHKVVQTESEMEIQAEMKNDAKVEHIEWDQALQNSAFDIRQSGIPAQTGLVNQYPFIIGREGDRQGLIELLQYDENSQQNVSFVLLVADGGMGKTTLSHLVYHDPSICESFDIRAWVSMPEISSSEGLLEAIIVSLTGISSGFHDLSELQEIVQEELTDKKFLLVLDNVFRYDQLFGSDFLDPLTSCAKGSIIMSLSRYILDIDVEWKIQTYYLNCLSESACWLIIQHCAFRNIHPSSSLDALEIGKKLVLKCEGKPLAAKVIGGLFPYILEDDIGRNILKSEFWNLDRNEYDIPPALKVSYDSLPNFLRNCYKFCSLFPRRHIFHKDHVLRLWMSLGFLNSNDKISEDEVGNKYFDELLSRSFFQSSQVCNFKHPYFEMHDLFYDLAESLSVKSEHMLRFRYSAPCDISDNIRHISLIPCVPQEPINLEMLQNCRQLESLLLINPSHVAWGVTINIANPNVLSDLFQYLVSLKALDLSFSSIKEIPDSIKQLKNLRYLGLSNTTIARLPESIRGLYQLQTIELRECAYLHELPHSLSYLVNLTHLDLSKKSGYVKTPVGIGHLTKLRSLSAFVVGEDEQYSGIQELRNLVNLRGNLCLGGLKYVVNMKDVEEANLVSKKHLNTLTLQWSITRGDILSDIIDEKVTKISENLQPHANLEELIIKDYPGVLFPGWVGNPSFENLTAVTIDNCPHCKELPPLGQLKSLRFLSIQKMNSIQVAGDSFCGSYLTGAFPSLEKLNLWEMYNLKYWYLRVRDFKSLRSLSISQCFKLDCLPHLPSLVELTIHFCNQLPSLTELPSLKSLIIEDMQNVTELNLQRNLTALEELEVKNCSQLLSLSGLEDLVSLKKLKLAKCPEIDFSPDACLPQALQVVEIHSCSLLQQWHPSTFQEIEATEERTKFIRK